MFENALSIALSTRATVNLPAKRSTAVEACQPCSAHLKGDFQRLFWVLLLEESTPQ